MAHILINEMERLQRADTPRSCRETFDAISSRIIYLEQTGMKMNADRQRHPKGSGTRRTVRRQRNPEYHRQDYYAEGNNLAHNGDTVLRKISRKQFPEDSNSNFKMGRKARRFEARRQNTCWRCFAKNHQSKECTVLGLCPKCNEPHHTSLCLFGLKKQDNGFVTLSRPPKQQSQGSQQFQARRWQHNQPAQVAQMQQPPPSSRNRQQGTEQRQAVQNSQSGGETAILDRTPSNVKQCVLQIATAMIFNEEEMDYQPVHLLLDSGAHRSFIKSQFSRGLKLSVFEINIVHDVWNGRTTRELQLRRVHTKEKLTTSLETAQLSEDDVKFISTREIHIAQQTLSRTSVSPDILIGQDLLSIIIDHAIWKAAFAQIQEGALVVVTPNVSSKDDYKQDIKHLYELGSLGIKTENDPDEDSILKFMDDYRKTIEIKDGTITAGFPFKDNAEKLKNNSNIAIPRLQALLKTLQKDGDKLKLYSETLQAYIKEGIIEESILNQCILKHIEEEEVPIGKELSKSLYVDNVLLEGDNADELFEKYINSKHVFSSIGMNVCRYLSNSKEVNEKISESDRAKSPEVKVLGLIWNAISDTLQLKCIDKEHTRDVHKQKLGWHETLPEEEQRRWTGIKNDIVGFTKSIPRKVLDKAFKAKLDLFIFVDSSKRAYACGLYITTISEDGSKSTQLFVGKSKIAPLKKEQTIPRLELLAIFLGLSVAETTILKTGVKFERINLFSDSTIALSWLRANKKLPPIVTTLVQKIGFTAERVRQTSQLTFFHVPTEENAADCATRGVNKSEFANCQWWTGPKWLNDSVESWPVTQMSDLRE
ncbi:Tas retrotransposon peptidase A16 [Oesophagostomum dentatum]|uniref:Tas retrotransposon peptidase A16 n=1 Tax=Oesophagostomum dentatum TaxID=61180 RepID=A0A0B1SPW0_OESDE|nr:Tas retrotransposon peptidase A16 [Oesophagostomum dentatum]